MVLILCTSASGDLYEQRPSMKHAYWVWLLCLSCSTSTVSPARVTRVVEPPTVAHVVHSSYQVGPLPRHVRVVTKKEVGDMLGNKDSFVLALTAEGCPASATTWYRGPVPVVVLHHVDDDFGVPALLQTHYQLTGRANPSLA